MNTTQSQPSRGKTGRASTGRLEDSSFVRIAVFLSRITTALFLAVLLWAIFRAVVNDDPLPVWAWFGALTLVAVGVGVIVALAVYQTVRRQAGPFNFHSSQRVSGARIDETRRVEAGGARSLRTEVRMTQGLLRLAGGSAGALEARFVYDDADWRAPGVAYTVDATGLGHLVVRQPATHRPAMHQGRSEWDVRLHDALPTELDVRLGAGNADLLLSGLNLTRLRVESGVGALLVDLAGEWTHSLEIFVKAGIGDTRLRLPRHAAVRVQPNVGLGSIQAGDLLWDGAAYTTPLYGERDVTLDVTIEGGMGRIDIELAG